MKQLRRLLIGWRCGSAPAGVLEAETCPRFRSLLLKVDCSTVSPLHLSSFTCRPDQRHDDSVNTWRHRDNSTRTPHLAGRCSDTPSHCEPRLPLPHCTCDEQNVSRANCQHPECCSPPQHHLHLRARLVHHHNGGQRNQGTRGWSGPQLQDREQQEQVGYEAVKVNLSRQLCSPVEGPLLDGCIAYKPLLLIP